jgi:hypothetical protein
MAALEISNIDLITNNDEIISLSPNMYKNFYLANLDKNGNEIKYEIIKDTLKANLLLLRIKKNEAINCYNILKENKNITNVAIHFSNGLVQKFQLSKRRVASEGKLINKYEEIIEIENDLCMIITNLNIKFKKELFA